MNVIVSNLNGDRFNNLNVDVIKSISGEFSADEIVQSFANFFFNKMFLDVTAVENYTDVTVFKRISTGLDVSKVILFLGDDPVATSSVYISRLISMGIYNFAKTEDELKYLYDNPNSYKDVAHLQKIEETVPVVETPPPSVSNNTNSGIVTPPKTKIIGFKNFTSHAGATTFIYMLKKILVRDYSVMAIEINREDFKFFNDSNMISCNMHDFANVIKGYSNVNIILVDLNDGNICEGMCNDIIYLMESSTLMINRVYMLDNHCFERIREKKMVLNKSLLNEKDIRLLERESGISFYSVIPNLNDRLSNNNELFPFLERLGFYRRV